MTRFVVIAGFLIAFAAGLVVGFDPHREPATPESPRSDRHSGWLAARLNLTPDQQEQLRTIWSDTAWRGGRERDERRRQLMRERDEAIVELIPAEDRPRYDEILRECAAQLRALDREWRDSFQTSVERTKEILTPEQRVKYEEMLNHQHSERRSWDRRRGGERKDGLRGDPQTSSRRGMGTWSGHQASAATVCEQR
jgi:Spy/CpxP family protein refolding chaperone